MSRPKGQGLTPTMVVEAAIACLEAEGESALGVNRVARALGIKPPSIYKHIDGNAALRHSVALKLWRRFLVDCHQQTDNLNDSDAIIRAIARTMRHFAQSHPVLYTVMTRTQLSLSDPEFAPIAQEILSFYNKALAPCEFEEAELIDAIRMIHAGLLGFIEAEKAGLFTLPRSLDLSFERMLDALIEALQSKAFKP
ncbi:transcriptional regulator [Calothrix sp. PCC 7716]|nr:transcriptional regulator [Calothrix sp. PCC 7716]